MNTDLQILMVVPSPMGLSITIILFVPIGKAVATKYCAMHVDFL